MDPCHCATVPTISPPDTPSPIMYTCPNPSYPVDLPLFFDLPGLQGALPILNAYPTCHLHHLFERGLQTTGRSDRAYVFIPTLQEQKLPKEQKAVSKFGQQWVASAELGLGSSPVLSHYPEGRGARVLGGGRGGGRKERALRVVRDVTHSRSKDPEERQCVMVSSPVSQKKK